jgi:Tat protein translocase TatB subunit
MFGIGLQEMVIIGLVLLVVFGPKKLPGMARDFGRFLSDARRAVEEFKEDLVEGQHEPEASEGLEEDVEREEDEVAPRNASRTG